MQPTVWNFHLPHSPIQAHTPHSPLIQPQSPNRSQSPLHQPSSPLQPLSSFGESLPASPPVFQSAPNSPLSSNFDDKWLGFIHSVYISNLLGSPPILPEIGSLDNSSSHHHEPLLLDPLITPPISPLRNDYGIHFLLTICSLSK